MKNNFETLHAKRGSRKAIMAAGSLAQLALNTKQALHDI